MSVDGSSVIIVQDDQLKALRQKIRARADENQALRDERDKPRQEQEIKLHLPGLRLEQQLMLDQQKKDRQLMLRRKEAMLRQQAEEKQRQEQEEQRREQSFVAGLAARGERIHQDALKMEKFPAPRHYSEQLKVEQELQATLTLPGLRYTPLLEIELKQAIEHERQSLSAFRQEAELLEGIAKEQELQEAQRLQQEQIIKQEVAAKQKQEAIDKQAAQYNRSTGPLTYEEAVTQLKAINRYIDAGASSRIIRVRATFLRTRCMNSRDAIPSTSVQAPTSDGVGTKVGAIMGGIFGIIGGPSGMAIGTATGGFIGNIADHAGDSAAISQASAEKKQWTTLIDDIDELVRRLPE